MTFSKFKATFHFPPSSVQKCNKMTFKVDNTFYKVTSTQTPSTCNSFSSPSARVTWFNAIQLLLCAKNSRLISFLFIRWLPFLLTPLRDQHKFTETSFNYFQEKKKQEDFFNFKAVKSVPSSITFLFPSYLFLEMGLVAVFFPADIDGIAE